MDTIVSRYLQTSCASGYVQRYGAQVGDADVIKFVDDEFQFNYAILQAWERAQAVSRNQGTHQNIVHSGSFGNHPLTNSHGGLQ